MRHDDPRHGTNAGYTAHMKLRVPSCAPCRAAHSAYRRGAKQRRRGPRSIYCHIDATGTQRRIRALMRIGWRYRDLENWLGVGKTLHNLNLASTKSVHVDSAKRVVAVYNALSMTPGPSEKTRRLAEAWGWPSPLAWDDDTIDDPKARPLGMQKQTYRSRNEIDEAMVIRAVRDGRRDEQIITTLTKAERAEVVRRMRAAGWSEGRIEEHTGIRADRYSHPVRPPAPPIAVPADDPAEQERRRQELAAELTQRSTRAPETVQFAKKGLVMAQRSAA
ncbi:hypothetical protein ACFPJ1_40535 [Kribbella qitaiheensis]|uniref:hypothetical protein n=1 Tax=Kribbella qitaiheensis TaxID=1544730 RepID=UPI003613BAD0